MLSTFKGLKEFLKGKDTLTANDNIIQPGGGLPELVNVKIHRCTNLYKPTVISNLKMDPYVAVYLTGQKDRRLKTKAISFGGSNPVIDEELRLPYNGEPVVVIQVFAKELLADEFIGEVPLDLLNVLNSHSRSWTGPCTVYGQKGTATRGEVHLTLNFRGGKAYDAKNPALTVAQHAQLTEGGDTKIRHRPVDPSQAKYGLYQQTYGNADPYKAIKNPSAATVWGSSRKQQKTLWQQVCCCCY